MWLRIGSKAHDVVLFFVCLFWFSSSWNFSIVDEQRRHFEQQMLKTRNCAVYDTKARIVFLFLPRRRRRTLAHTQKKKKVFGFRLKSLFLRSWINSSLEKEEEVSAHHPGSSHRLWGTFLGWILSRNDRACLQAQHPLRVTHRVFKRRCFSRTNSLTVCSISLLLFGSFGPIYSVVAVSDLSELPGRCGCHETIKTNRSLATREQSSSLRRPLMHIKKNTTKVSDPALKKKRHITFFG